MYNLAKLLAESPEKIERLIILFFKLLITLYIGITLFGLNISISGFIENPILEDYTITKFILFFILLVVIWFTVWSLISELIFGELLIWIISKIGSRKFLFNDLLALLKVIEKNDKNISPNVNVIAFNNLLNNFNEDDKKKINENKSRIRQYYLVVTVTFISLLFAKDINLPCWFIWFSGIIIFNLLIINALLNKIHNYFEENFDEMKKHFGRLAYMQMVVNAIEQNPFFKLHYEKSVKRSKIHLKLKTKSVTLPKIYNFHPVYHWNELLTREIVNNDIHQQSGKKITSKNIGKYYDVVVCNIKPDDDDMKRIYSKQDFAYLYCENEEQIHKNLEVFLFKVSNGLYRIY